MQTNPNDFLSETELDDEDDEKLEYQLAQQAVNEKLETEEADDIESLSESEGEDHAQEESKANDSDVEMADPDEEVVKQGGKNPKRRKV